MKKQAGATCPNFWANARRTKTATLLHALIESLREANRIKPKTIRNVYGALRTLFRDAVIDELINATPCVLPKGVLPPSVHVEKRIYAREDVNLLLTSAKIPLDRRAFYALAVLTGMRHGEASLAALRLGRPTSRVPRSRYAIRGPAAKDVRPEIAPAPGPRSSHAGPDP